ncbi:MAG TPA: hypothetical protein VGB59_08315 [Allosphingosinicella sp.]|jgi:hypothetical protein
MSERETEKLDQQLANEDEAFWEGAALISGDALIAGRKAARLARLAVAISLISLAVAVIALGKAS